MVGKRPTSVVVDGFELDLLSPCPHVGYGAALHSSPTPATAAVSAPSGTAA